MPEDEKDVQEGEVSEETTSQEEEESKQKEAPKPQPLTPEVEAKIQELIEKTTEHAKREIQSVKDKARAEVEAAQRRASLAEATATGFTEGLEGEDRERAESMQNKLKLQAYQHREVEEAQRKAVEQFGNAFYGNFNQFLTSLGIDPKDSRIDLAEDVESDYLLKQQRILKSVGDILKDNAEKTSKKQKQEAKEKEAEENKDVDSVETGETPGGGVSDGEFLKKFAGGDLPATEANIKRAEKIMNK